MSDRGSARDLIETLRGRGFTNSAIAREFGIDSSTISQVLKGAKPGRNLVPGLSHLVRQDMTPRPKPRPGETVLPRVNREIRTAKSGGPARVRQPEARRPAREGAAATIRTATVRTPSSLERRLERAAARGNKVQMSVGTKGFQRKERSPRKRHDQPRRARQTARPPKEQRLREADGYKVRLTDGPIDPRDILDDWRQARADAQAAGKRGISLERYLREQVRGLDYVDNVSGLDDFTITEQPDE